MVVAVAVVSCFEPLCMSTKAMDMSKKQRSMFFRSKFLFWDDMKACCYCVAQERGHYVKQTRTVMICLGVCAELLK